MPNAQFNILRFSSDQWLALIFSVPWLEVLAEAYRLARKLWQGLADEGMYEVLEYKSTLELLDAEGKQARFHKVQQVRYRQNNIIAYQDQGWGDGESLLNYQCSPGVVVDQYRPGRETYTLISLRENRQKGDEDLFHIQWELRDAFVRDREQWETKVNHRTHRVDLQVIFPKDRPPIRVWIEEALRRHSRPLESSATRQLVDGRWQLGWSTAKPRLHERYILKWEW